MSRKRRRRRRRCSNVRSCLQSLPFIGIFILVVVLMLTKQNKNNPDGSCTNPVIRMFDSTQEYNRRIHDDSPIAELHYIPMYNKRGHCLDGSNPALYYRKGAATHKYHIHFEGAGFCFDYATCGKRSQNAFGSSTFYKQYAHFSDQYLSTNKDKNPLTHDWNAVFVRSCDGMNYLANKQSISVFEKKQIYFEGFIILQNLFKFLFDEFELNKASDIIISGNSAGGFAVLFHADFIWNAYIQKLKIKNEQFRFMLLIDSGYYRLVHPHTYKNLHWLQQNMKIEQSVNEKCKKYLDEMAVCNDDGEKCEENEGKKEVFHCLLAEYFMPFIDENVKIFLMQSRFDFHYQNEDKKEFVKTMNKMGDEYAQFIMNEFVKNTKHKMHRGVFVDSCKHRGGMFNNIEIDGWTVSEAMFEFYYADINGTERNVWFQNHKYPCNHCCNIPSASKHVPSLVNGC